MTDQPISRRAFVQRMTAGSTALALGHALPALASSEALRIEEPFHGAILNHRHGEPAAGGLKIRVRGEAPAHDQVTVNGVVASRAGGRFTAEVIMRHQETHITAVSQGESGRRQHQVRVVWDKFSQPRYRFSIDDNSFFLRDVWQKQYASLFDCWYLKMLCDLHTRFGTRFVLNVYYTTADGFDLTQFPDRYRGEWKDNAHWLKLAFHAHANDPDRPYQNAPVRQLIADLDQVSEQIVRFAGKATLSPPTVIHWAMTPPEAFTALYQRGVRVLSGYFRRSGSGWDINYRLDDERSEYLSRHDALKDFASGIIFSKVDMVVNTTPLNDIVPALTQISQDPNQAEVMDLFTHEQYFWPFYRQYLPDHPRRLETAIRWVTEHGYKPVFFHEGFLEKAKG